MRVLQLGVRETLIAKWQNSPEWSNLAPNTQRTWNSSVRVIGVKWGKVPLAVFNNSRMIAKVVDCATSLERRRGLLTMASRCCVR